MDDFEHVFVQVSEDKLRIFFNYYRTSSAGASDSLLQTVSHLMNNKITLS